MTAPGVEIIVSLPARNVDEVRAALPSTVRAGADAAEIRFDRWSDLDWKSIPALFPSPLALVATYRSRADGGSGADDPDERGRRLEMLDALPFRYLDLERRRDTRMIGRLARRTSPPRPIVSTHFGEAWSTEGVRRALEPEIRGHAIVKVVAPASVSQLYGQLRPLLPRPARDPPSTLLTVGASGAVLRALSRRLKLPIVYASPPATDGGVAQSPPVEQSQIRVDALAPFLRAPSEGRLFAIVGHPVAHSLSPQLHEGWYAREKRAALYVPIDIAPEEEFGKAIDSLGGDGFVGFNVTHPWKREALALAAHAGSDARRAGCANALTREGERWTAENFDVRALVRRIKELRDQEAWPGGDLLVLGAGGAARAAIVAGLELGARTSVLARSRPQANELARELGAESVGGPGTPASLVIHATTVGMPGNSGTLPTGWAQRLASATYVLDMVYRPAAPKIREAAARGAGPYEDGSRLLVYQAAESYRHWWGEAPGRELESWALGEVGCAA